MSAVEEGRHFPYGLRRKNSQSRCWMQGRVASLCRPYGRIASLRVHTQRESPISVWATVEGSFVWTTGKVASLCVRYRGG